jgi:hypothetical protein
MEIIETSTHLAHSKAKQHRHLVAACGVNECPLLASKADSQIAEFRQLKMAAMSRRTAPQHSRPGTAASRCGLNGIVLGHRLRAANTSALYQR